jgi:hypothetical protein
MNASRGMYIRNTAHIILNLEYIRNSDINELYASGRLDKNAGIG